MNENVDGNIYALNKHLEEQEKAERDFEFFEDDTMEHFKEINRLIDLVNSCAEDYPALELDEHIKETISSMI